MAGYLVKPPAPIWQPDLVPAGCKAFYLLHEGKGSGKVLDLSGNNYHGTLTGTGASSSLWQAGSYGPQLSGFSTTLYGAIDPPTQLLATGVYPFWIASLAVTTGTAGAWTIMAGRSTTTNPLIGLNYNSGTVLKYFVRDDAGGGPGATLINGVSVSLNDGLPHVVMGVSWAASDHRLYYDGRQIGTSTATLGTTTLDRLTIGANRRTTISEPFTGGVIATALGVGAVPDPRALAADWLAGQFAVAQPQRDMATWLAAATRQSLLGTLGAGT